jgi:hypothetical protein
MQGSYDGAYLTTAAKPERLPGFLCVESCVRLEYSFLLSDVGESTAWEGGGPFLASQHRCDVVSGSRYQHQAVNRNVVPGDAYAFERGLVMYRSTPNRPPEVCILKFRIHH